MNTRKMVLGIFGTDQDTETALHKLSDAGFSAKNISVIAKREGKVGPIKTTGESAVGTGVISGIETGGIIGAIVGLLIGVGFIVIPGIGTLLIGGPLAVALGLTGAAATTVTGAVTGAVAGGIAGGLIGIGVSNEDAKYYEECVRKGMILMAVESEADRVDEVRQIMEGQKADQVRVINID